MRSMKMGYWRCGAMAALWVGLSLAQAADTVNLTLTMQPGQISGRVLNNSRLGQGQLSFDGEHVGFQVWSEAATPGPQPNSYIISGQANSSNKLRIRLEQDGWQVDKEGGKGIFVRSSERSVSFNVVADGDQTLKPDRYNLSLTGALLQP